MNALTGVRFIYDSGKARFFLTHSEMPDEEVTSEEVKKIIDRIEKFNKTMRG